jgi:hypothetical protein
MSRLWATPRYLLLGAVMSAALATAMLGATSARAAFGLSEVSVRSINADGSADTRAGGHPWGSRVEIGFNSAPLASDPSQTYPEGSVRDVVVDLPAGFVGNPEAVPACQPLDLAKISCAAGSQVGVLTLTTRNDGHVAPQYTVPVFNMVPRDGRVAELGFYNLGVPFHIQASVLSGDEYKVRTVVSEISQAVRIERIKVTLWGDPASQIHDPQRGSNYACPFDQDNLFYCANPEFFVFTNGGFSAGVERRWFLSNPTVCGVAPQATVRVRSWQEPERWVSATAADEPITGCDALRFEPSVEARFAGAGPGAPSGLTFDLNVPQSYNPQQLATPPLKTARVTLPEGVAINPAVADGLLGCTDAEVGIGSERPVACPDASKLGGLRITTPLLPQTLEGAVYVGQPLPGNMYRLFLVAESPRYGLSIRIEGRLQLDAVSGRVTAVFDSNPQLPFSNLEMELKTGARAPLTMPERCGTYTTEAELTPWSGPVARPTSSFVLSRNCDGAVAFAPRFEAGTSSALAGTSSPFTLRVGRGDGEQNVSRIDARLPEGLLAKLAGVRLCGDAQAAGGDCPADSRIGTSTVGVGAGANPLYVPQPGKSPTAVYLAGRYKGAPYSLVVAVPAQAGPFDLGTVVVRSAIHVDPLTTQVSVRSDALPQILQGIPVKYRDIRVDIGREDFIVNPTSCEPKSLAATVFSAEGAGAAVSTRFQVAGCERLAFKPKLALSLKGAMKRSGNPALTAVLTQPKGQNANIAGTQVLLPKTMFIDNAHVNSPCTRVQFNAGACPAKSILGTAVAYTPLLDKPLEGPVYFRSNGGERELPDLVADLDGQIHVTLVGFIDSVKVGKEGSRVRTRFQNVPDAPVSRFVLRLKGGKRGLIENSVDLCRVAPKAGVKLVGQNGKASEGTQAIRTSCKGGDKSKKGKG